MVSCSVGNAVRLYTATSSYIEPIPTDIRCQSDRSGTPTSRMAYLWQKFGGGNFSEATKELLLGSKTSKAYDSHFKKWLGWCTERGLNSVSVPILDVANFLADLHAQGYQTSSLNTYRSAISSVHDRVDDMDVSKHPLVARVLSLPCQATSPTLYYYLECSSSIKLHLKVE